MNDPTQPVQATQPVQPTPQRTAPARHPVVVGHLVMGVAFLGLLTVWALVAGDVVEGTDIRFLLPAPWVLGGVAGLVALIASDRRRHPRHDTGWIDTSVKMDE